MFLSKVAPFFTSKMIIYQSIKSFPDSGDVEIDFFLIKNAFSFLSFSFCTALLYYEQSYKFHAAARVAVTHCAYTLNIQQFHTDAHTCMYTHLCTSMCYCTKCHICCHQLLNINIRDIHLNVKWIGVCWWHYIYCMGEDIIKSEYVATANVVGVLYEYIICIWMCAYKYSLVIAIKSQVNVIKFFCLRIRAYCFKWL